MTTVAMLGSGIMASALTVPLADNGHEIHLVGTHLDREIIESVRADGTHPGLKVKLPSAVTAYQLEEAEEAFEGAEVVLSGVNSFGVRWASEQLAGLLKPDQHVVTIAKGMEATPSGDLRILPDVLAEHVPEDLRDQVTWSAIVGPSIAGEVAVRHDTCVVFAGHRQSVLDRLADLWRTEHYHVWTSTDLVGAEVCAATKNCYALGVGMAAGVLEKRGEADGLYRMHNYEAALFGQGALEMAQFVELLGGRPETASGLPAVGDCYVTSAGGRNVRVGKLLGQGMGFTEAAESLGNPTLEGAAAIKVIGGALDPLTERGIIGADDFPLLRHLHEVVGLEQPLDMPWNSFYGGPAATSAGRRSPLSAEMGAD
jgi:glycerol-3-phosphate dehydrogenase (NAD(P)+)